MLECGKAHESSSRDYQYVEENQDLVSLKLSL